MLRRISPLLALLVVSALTMLAFDRPLVRGDGLAYLAWVDTLALDLDVDLSNQVERLKPVVTYQIQWNEATQRWVIIFPFGAGLLQAPFYAVGDWFERNGWLNINPDYFHQMQGVGFPYSFWLMIGANVLALAALALMWLTGRRWCDDWTAALAVYAVFLGTPLFYYSTIAPMNSHNPGAFAVAAYLYLLVVVTGAFREQPESDRFRWPLWVLLGVCAGLAIMARWQLALAVAPGWILLVWERRWRGLIVATSAAAITLLPLPLIWQQLFGSPFLIPFDAVEGQEHSFLSAPNHTLDVLVETLVHSPVIIISLIGIARLWRTYRRWAVMAAAMFGLQILINGIALDWWAGDSYGMRRMSELYGLYALLACAALGRPLLKFYAPHFRTVHRLVLAGVIGYTGLYIGAFLVYSWTNPQGWFLGRPEVMIGYFLNHPYRLEVLREVYQTHVGPLAWAQPGP